MQNNMLLILCLAISLVPTPALSGYPASGYGYNYNKYPYLPAPPGQTPSCAKYGATFCEKVDTYPNDAIQYLLFKWGYTYSQFIKSERNEDFMLMLLNETYGPKLPTYGPFYGAPSSHYSQVVHNNSASSYNNYSPQEGPGPAPSFQFQPSPPYFNNGGGWNGVQGHEAAAVIIPPIVHAIWWNHRDKTTNQPAFPYLPQNRFHRIQKRQVTTDENQVCPVRSMFTVPQAAMNNEGNWMYVVNMGDTRYAQQVRTEVCAGGDRSACSGLCQVPPGYSATCRQKYVQKRLIALDGSGGSLRGEVFWFPHCCVCEIVPTTS